MCVHTYVIPAVITETNVVAPARIEKDNYNITSIQNTAHALINHCDIHNLNIL